MDLLPISHGMPRETSVPVPRELCSIAREVAEAPAASTFVNNMQVPGTPACFSALQCTSDRHASQKIRARKAQEVEVFLKACSLRLNLLQR